MPQIRVIEPTIIQATKLRVAAYCRVSSDSEDQLHSFANQLKTYQNLIASKPNWELVDLYADEGITGTYAGIRPEFQRLMRDCRKGRIDKIMVKSISRFARNTVDCLTSIRELNGLGVEVYFEKEDFSSAEMGGELLLSIQGMLAQQESVSISSNMRWSIQKRMERGELITMSAAYGYMFENGNLYVNEDEAKIVRWMFKSYLSGMSTTEITDHLRRHDIPTRKGTKIWQHTAVQYILANEKYIGDSVMMKSYIVQTLPVQRRKNKGEETDYYIENTHPPIISKEDFLKAQRLLKQRNVSNANQHHHPFRKAIVCNECGYHFVRKPGQDKYFWVCCNQVEGKKNCSAPRLQEAYVEQAFVCLYNKLCTNYRDILLPMLEQLKTLQAFAHKENQRLCDLDLQILELSQHNQALAQLRTKGYLDAAMYHQQVNHNNTQIGQLRQQRTHLLEDDEDETTEQTERLIDLLQTGPDHLAEFDAALFQSMVKQITVHSFDRIELELINGLILPETLPDTRRYRP